MPVDDSYKAGGYHPCISPPLIRHITYAILRNCFYTAAGGRPVLSRGVMVGPHHPGGGHAGLDGWRLRNCCALHEVFATHLLLHRRGSSRGPPFPTAATLPCHCPKAAISADPKALPPSSITQNRSSSTRKASGRPSLAALAAT